MRNLIAAITDKFSSSALSTDVGGRIYLDQAPDGCEFPYVVFFIVSGVPDDVFAKKGKNILMQFSLFSASGGATEITTMYADLLTLFDDCTMTITSNVLVDMHLNNFVTMVEDITTADGTQTVKHWAVDFEVITQAA